MNQLLSKVVDQYRAEGMNIDVATLLGRNKPKDASTATERDQTFDEEREELENKIRELEFKLKRGGMRSNSMGEIGSDLDDEAFNSKLLEIQEQLKK
jgi:KaiC/GvpD/RAD55 family RecA-like ATPase